MTNEQRHVDAAKQRLESVIIQARAALTEMSIGTSHASVAGMAAGICYDANAAMTELQTAQREREYAAEVATRVEAVTDNRLRDAVRDMSGAKKGTS